MFFLKSRKFFFSVVVKVLWEKGAALFRPARGCCGWFGDCPLRLEIVARGMRR